MFIRYQSVQFSRSVVSNSLRPRESQHARPPCSSPTPRVHSDSRPFESVMPSSHLILCRPLLLLPPIPPSIRVFSNESTLRMRWPKYWSFSFSIIPSKEIPGLISFRMDWLGLLAVQRTLKSLLQHHGSKASILGCSALFTVQLSHPYISSVQFSRSVVSDSLRPHESQHARPPCSSPSPGVQLKLTSIESVMPSSYLILYHPLLLLSSIFPSIRVFSSESALHTE